MLIGIIFVIIFLSILILVHELGHFLAAKKFGLLVEEFGFGLPPKIFAKKIGETDYSINALPFGGFVKIFGENREENASISPERNFSNLKIWKRAIVLAAGVGFNFLLGWLAISLVFAIGTPSVVIITEIKKNSPAEEVGLLAGDRIAEFTNVNDFIDFVNSHQGEKIKLKIEREGKTLELEAIPRKNPPIGEGSLGVGLVDAGLEKQNIFMSFWEGLKTSLNSIKTIFLAIINLIGKAFVGKASFEQVTGPIGIVKITAQASTLGIVYLLQLLALISLNLAVINILPFPALDGGRLFFLLIEKIKGSPLDQKFEKITNAVGFAILIFLMIVITIKDIIKL
ncbi:RIP metalloprotease RseP [Candidatus Wolfebacteria bacterium RIFCSPLOWO2_01_FULL_38_11]|uniref:Zinc metalloprotease n=1 Tax=Candidatus Wolfebacteria bacterium RIFCSPLOWO2_01_FULL_38_11 TaxID=1802556 RepID=A0A1F8DUE6_9BACT|nr:MAG: RIP metalloprotease RseP [Candidatus Wolfebacteria bacterium RIFCSPLOWO2_01_FULL_38_11]